MGCFPKNNQVLPEGVENDQPPRAIRSKAKKRKSRKGKGFWKMFTKFFTGLLCVSSTTANVPFKNSVAPDSMYGNVDADSDEEEGEGQPSTTPVQPPPRRGFQEVQLTMAPNQVEGAQGTGETAGSNKVKESEGKEGKETTEESEETSAPAPAPAPAPPAKLTVPITELPKPNECSNSQDTRTTNEIIKEFRDTGLVADVVGENVTPNGMSYEIRIDTVRVRPKTAKGFRVPKPPRRLQSLGVKLPVVGEEKEKLADKIKEKQEKAALKRQEMKQSQLQKKKEKDEKQQKAVQFVTAANDQKKRETAEKIAIKAERVKSARLSHLQDRQRKVEQKAQKQEKAVQFVTAANDQRKRETAEKMAIKAERVKSARLSHLQDRQRKVEQKAQKQEKAVQFVVAANEQKKKEAAETIACKAERVKSARLCSDQKRQFQAAAKRRHRETVRRRCDCQECPDVEYDKISTYNGSSTSSSRSGSACSGKISIGSDDTSPLYYKTIDYLVPIERDENHDDFFDGPVGQGEDN